MSRPTLETYGVCHNLMFNERLLTLKFLNVTLESLKTLARNQESEFRKKIRQGYSADILMEDKKEDEKNYGENIKAVIKENYRLLNNGYQVPYGRDEPPISETIDEDLASAIDMTQLWIENYIDLIGYYSLWSGSNGDYEDLPSMMGAIRTNRLNTERRDIRYQWVNLPIRQSNIFAKEPVREERKEEVKEEEFTPPRRSSSRRRQLSPVPVPTSPPHPSFNSPERQRRQSQNLSRRSNNVLDVYQPPTSSSSLSSSSSRSRQLMNPLSTPPRRSLSRRSMRQRESPTNDVGIAAIDQSYFSTLFPPPTRSPVGSPRQAGENQYDLIDDFRQD
jgi:hypothetical protein